MRTVGGSCRAHWCSTEQRCRRLPDHACWRAEGSTVRSAVVFTSSRSPSIAAPCVVVQVPTWRAPLAGWATTACWSRVCAGRSNLLQQSLWPSECEGAGRSWLGWAVEGVPACGLARAFPPHPPPRRRRLCTTAARTISALFPPGRTQPCCCCCSAAAAASIPLPGSAPFVSFFTGITAGCPALAPTQ